MDHIDKFGHVLTSVIEINTSCEILSGKTSCVCVCGSRSKYVYVCVCIYIDIYKTTEKVSRASQFEAPTRFVESCLRWVEANPTVEMYVYCNSNFCK